MGATAVTWPGVVSRVLAGLIGGYAFVWGFTTLSITLLVAGGMAYDEAWTLVMLLAFILFLCMLCWAFAAASLARVWAVLAGGGGVMTFGAWLLTRQLVS